MSDPRETALRMAVAACSGAQDPKHIVRMAKAFEEYLCGKSADGTGPEANPVEYPSTFTRVTDTAGHTYDRHTIPPFMNPNAGKPTSPADPISDIYDLDKMKDRGEGNYDPPKIKTAYGNKRLSD